MKTTIPSIHHQGHERGFTLIEMSVAMIVSISIGAIMMALLQQQISFHRIMRTQNFLVEEAPQINHTITSVLAQADAYRIHANLTDAVSDTNAVTADGKTLVLGYTNPDGSQQYGIIAFETVEEQSYLGYYNLDPSASFAGAGNPDWIISRGVTDATFFVENGVFRMEVAGPVGETITYSGTPRL
jgi:type II secretory pathway pseudopilin PulG